MKHCVKIRAQSDKRFLKYRACAQQNVRKSNSEKNAKTCKQKEIFHKYLMKIKENHYFQQNTICFSWETTWINFLIKLFGCMTHLIANLFGFLLKISIFIAILLYNLYKKFPKPASPGHFIFIITSQWFNIFFHSVKSFWKPDCSRLSLL